MSTARRVIKNTGFLYMKMGITVFVTLYTTRLILSTLGASDFGLFSIVGGAIGMLGFLNSTLANATQRFMSYAEGGGSLEEKKKIFNISIGLHLIVAGLTLLILIAAMFPLFNGILNIDPQRLSAARVVYLSLVASTMLTIINVPYDAVINAHEDMLYYSIIGVADVMLKLAVAVCCVYTAGDKLIVYAILMACIPLITLSIMKIYCHRRYEECELHIVRYWDAATVRQIATFSGWNFLTAVTSLFTYQGIGLVLNHFFGTALNAANGIATQLKGQLSALSVTMLKALNPVIVKNAGADNLEGMNRATLAGCTFSTLLILLFAIPFSIEMHYILSIWLVDVPDWTMTFCIMQLIMTALSQITSPVATAVYAQGEIRQYAIWKSVTNLLPIVITYISFRLGGSPIWLYIPMIAIWALGGNLIVLHYARLHCQLDIGLYIRKVITPLTGVTVVMSAVSYLPSVLIEESLMRLMLTLTLSTATLCLATWSFALTKEEKHNLQQLITSRTR